jgi:hypothetical protein
MHAVGNYLVGKEWCPHVLWNPFTGEMIQYYPASVGSRALMYNDQDGAVCVQIEVFFTPGCVVDGVKYATVADTPLKGWDTLIQWADSLGVPRAWPMGAPQWTGNARDVATWNGHGGHYGHCHSPGDDHTDPGPMPAFPSGALSAESSTITPATITALQEEGTNMALIITQPKGDPGIYIGNGLTYRRIPDLAALASIRDLGKWGVLDLYKNGDTQSFPLSALGVLVKDAA